MVRFYKYVWGVLNLFDKCMGPVHNQLDKTGSCSMKNENAHTTFFLLKYDYGHSEGSLNPNFTYVRVSVNSGRRVKGP